MTTHYNGNEEQLEREIEEELTKAQKEVELDERIDQLAADLNDEFEDCSNDDLCSRCGAPITECACMEDNQDRYGTGLFDRDPGGGYPDDIEFIEIEDDEELGE